MSPGIAGEWAVFVQAVLAGNVVYLAYCILRVFRSLVKHSLFIISIEDFCYWVGVGLYLFIRICQTSNGIIRWYFVFGVILGGIITHLTISKIMKKYLAKHKKRE